MQLKGKVIEPKSGDVAIFQFQEVQLKVGDFFKVTQGVKFQFQEVQLKDPRYSTAYGGYSEFQFQEVQLKVAQNVKAHWYFNYFNSKRCS